MKEKITSGLAMQLLIEAEETYTINTLREILKGLLPAAYEQMKKMDGFKPEHFTLTAKYFHIKVKGTLEGETK